MGLEWVCEGTLVIEARLHQYTIKVSLVHFIFNATLRLKALLAACDKLEHVDTWDVPPCCVIHVIARLTSSQGQLWPDNCSFKEREEKIGWCQIRWSVVPQLKFS